MLCDGKAPSPSPRPGLQARRGRRRGPNTGGMGAFAPITSPRLLARVTDAPSRRRSGAAPAGHHYRGVLYAGLMLTPDGPKLLSTTSASAIPRPRSSLPYWRRAADCCCAAANGALDEAQSPTPATRRSGWYWRRPATPAPRRVTSSGPRPRTAHCWPVEGVTVFHAGTRRPCHGQFVHGRRPGARCHGHSPRRSPRRATAPTPPPSPLSGRACRCATTSRPARRAPLRRWRVRAPDDPALLTPGHGRPLQRRRPFLARGSRWSSWRPRPRPPSGSCRRTRRRPAGPRRRWSTTSSWPTCSSGGGSPTTTWPPSSTSSRPGSSPHKRARRYTLASRPLTSSTPRRAPGAAAAAERA